MQTVLTLGAFAYVEFAVPYPDHAHWQGPILFDAASRNALVASSQQGRRRAALFSDITWYAPMTLPWIEALALPLFGDHWNFEVAWELTLMNAQATSVVALLTRVGHKFVARARPDTEPCKRDASYDDTCFGGTFAGFPSGHVSAGMLGAGLLCAHHLSLSLLGDAPVDVAVCVTGTAMGLANGVGRIAADRHYLTDVIAGAILGFGAGFGMPVLLHYRWFGSAPKRSWALLPWITGESFGAGAAGLW